MTPGKTFTVIAGEDAVLPFEDCLFSSRFENDTTLVVPDFYTDRDTFLENVQSFFEDPYDDIPEGGATVLQRSDGTFSYDVTAPGPGTNTLFNGNGFLSTNSEFNRLLFTFTGAPVTAVGGNFWTTDQLFNATGTDIILTLDDGTERVFGPSSVDSFAGFVTEVPIVSLSIEAPDNSSFPAADNLIVGQR